MSHSYHDVCTSYFVHLLQIGRYWFIFILIIIYTNNFQHSSTLHKTELGGAWDNSDVKGAKKKRWLSSDKDYADGGFKKSQSISILGEGQGLDWTGKRNKTGPGMSTVKPGKFTKNYQAPNVNAIKGGGAVEKPKKKMFGFF